MVCIVKHMSGFSAVDYMRFKWKEFPNPYCPCLSITGIKETTQHQMHCTYLPRIKIQRSSGISYDKNKEHRH